MDPVVPMMFVLLFIFLTWFFKEIAKDFFQSDP